MDKQLFPVLSRSGLCLGRGGWLPGAAAEAEAAAAGEAEQCYGVPNSPRPCARLSIIGHLPLASPDVCLYGCASGFSLSLVKSSSWLGYLLFILFEFLIMCKMFQAPLGDTKDSKNTVSGGGSSL